MPTYNYLLFLTRKKYAYSGHDIVNLVRDICPEVRDFESGSRMPIYGYSRVVIGSRGPLPDTAVAAQRLFGRLRPPAFTYGPCELYRETWNPETATYGPSERAILRFDTLRVRVKPAYREYTSLVLPELFRQEGGGLFWQGSGTLTNGALQHELEDKFTSGDIAQHPVIENHEDRSGYFTCLNLNGQIIPEQLSHELAFIHNGIDVEYKDCRVLHFTPHDNGSERFYQQEMDNYLAWSKIKPIGPYGGRNYNYPEPPTIGQSLEAYFTVADFL